MGSGLGFVRHFKWSHAVLEIVRKHVARACCPRHMHQKKVVNGDVILPRHEA